MVSQPKKFVWRQTRSGLKNPSWAEGAYWHGSKAKPPRGDAVIMRPKRRVGQILSKHCTASPSFWVSNPLISFLHRSLQHSRCCKAKAFAYQSRHLWICVQPKSYLTTALLLGSCSEVWKKALIISNPPRFRNHSSLSLCPHLDALQPCGYLASTQLVGRRRRDRSYFCFRCE